MNHWQMILTASVFKLDCNIQCLSSTTPSLEVLRIFKSTAPFQVENTKHVVPPSVGKVNSSLPLCITASLRIFTSADHDDKNCIRHNKFIMTLSDLRVDSPPALDTRSSWPLRVLLRFFYTSSHHWAFRSESRLSSSSHHPSLTNQIWE